MRNSAFIAGVAVLLVSAQTRTALDGHVLLGRPTDRSITLNVLAAGDLDAFAEYGVKPSTYTAKTAVVHFQPDKPVEIRLEPLRPDTDYVYRLRYRTPGTARFDPGEERHFHTARPPGRAFTFALQADPHLDEVSNPDVYRRSLRDEAASSSDFLIDLGDTFMSDKLESKNWNEVVRRHLLARSYYELVGHSLPLFLVLGNHEGENSRQMDGSAENLAVWAAKARKLYYPNPQPDGFYSGGRKPEPFIGLRQNYYAWAWGDALFVALDPFWYSTARGSDSWSWSLGREQYDWLKSTLEQSRVKYKFVFAHNLVGGLDLDGRARGGIEGVPYYEWGGHNQDGSWGFTDKRPGWAMPIHHLLVKNNVTAFFHGHDHLYAKQELDGVVYQEVPQPSAGRVRTPSGQYAYTHGDILPGSGYMRFRVAPDGVQASFMRTDAGPAEVAHTYAILPRAANPSESPTAMSGSKVAAAPAQDAHARPRKGGRKGGGRSLGKQPPPADGNNQ